MNELAHKSTLIPRGEGTATRRLAKYKFVSFRKTAEDFLDAKFENITLKQRFSTTLTRDQAKLYHPSYVLCRRSLRK